MTCMELGYETPWATLAQAVMGCAGAGVVVTRFRSFAVAKWLEILSLHRFDRTLRQVSTSLRKCTQSLPYIRLTDWPSSTSDFVLLSFHEQANHSMVL